MNSQPNSRTITHCLFIFNGVREPQAVCQVAQADAQTKAWQRVCLSHPDKIELKKSSLPSENKKYATTQSDTTNTEKRNIDNGLQGRTKRTTGYNSCFAKKRVQWLIEHSTSHQLLCYVDSFVLRNPPLRQAPKRCAS